MQDVGIAAVARYFNTCYYDGTSFSATCAVVIEVVAVVRVFSWYLLYASKKTEIKTKTQERDVAPR